MSGGPSPVVQVLGPSRESTVTLLKCGMIARYTLPDGSVYEVIVTAEAQPVDDGRVAEAVGPTNDALCRAALKTMELPEARDSVQERA